MSPCLVATYHVKVFELRTRREVHSLALLGLDADVLNAKFRDGRLLSQPTDANGQKALAEWSSRIAEVQRMRL